MPYEKGKVEVGFYNNPQEVGYAGWMSSDAGTVFIKMGVNENVWDFEVYQDKKGTLEKDKRSYALEEFIISTMEYTRRRMMDNDAEKLPTTEAKEKHKAINTGLTGNCHYLGAICETCKKEQKVVSSKKAGGIYEIFLYCEKCNLTTAIYRTTKGMDSTREEWMKAIAKE